MNCIIVDDEPLAREAMKLLIEESNNLQLIGSFNSASTASDFMEQHVADLVFLDIQMPGITGIEFARTISKKTLVIFTTAYTEYALDSYEVDAIDYLIKPVEAERFQKAVDKALSYHSLLLKKEKEAMLAPDERAILNKTNGRMTVETVTASNASQWTDGYLFFDEELLPDIVKELERSYNVTIRIANDSLNTFRFYGNFARREQSIQEVMDALASTEKIKYKIETRKITIY